MANGIAAALREAHERTELAWLIEISGPSWWDGRGPSTFTRDPSDVFRMARREDAERALAWKLCIPPVGEVSITEHAWPLTSARGASTEECALREAREPLEKEIAALRKQLADARKEASFVAFYEGRLEEERANAEQAYEHGREQGALEERLECHRIAADCERERVRQMVGMNDIGRRDCVDAKATEAGRIADKIAARGPMSQEGGVE